MGESRNYEVSFVRYDEFRNAYKEYFQCQAENPERAIEQAKDAYPDGYSFYASWDYT